MNKTSSWIDFIENSLEKKNEFYQITLLGNHSSVWSQPIVFVQAKIKIKKKFILLI